MSRISAAALAMAACLIGAHLSVNPASADGPLSGVSDSGLVPAPVDTYLICCAPIVTGDPEPVLESLPVPSVEDTIEPILSSDPLDVAQDNPVVDVLPEQLLLPTQPPLQPAEAILPAGEEPGSVSPSTDNQVPDLSQHRSSLVPARRRRPWYSRRSLHNTPTRRTSPGRGESLIDL